MNIATFLRLAVVCKSALSTDPEIVTDLLAVHAVAVIDDLDRRVICTPVVKRHRHPDVLGIGIPGIRDELGNRGGRARIACAPSCSTRLPPKRSSRGNSSATPESAGELIMRQSPEVSDLRRGS